jgi:hypothetical protein
MPENSPSSIPPDDPFDKILRKHGADDKEP